MSSSRRPDSAETILVLAKEPVPGRVKTRLQARFSAVEAASLAACAIEDTLEAVRASRASRKVLVWDGNPYPWSLEFDSVPASRRHPERPARGGVPGAAQATGRAQRC